MGKLSHLRGTIRLNEMGAGEAMSETQALKKSQDPRRKMVLTSLMAAFASEWNK